MVSALLSADVYAGKKSFNNITLHQSALDENGVTDIDHNSPMPEYHQGNTTKSPA